MTFDPTWQRSYQNCVPQTVCDTSGMCKARRDLSMVMKCHQEFDWLSWVFCLVEIFPIGFLEEDRCFLRNDHNHLDVFF